VSQYTGLCVDKAAAAEELRTAVDTREKLAVQIRHTASDAVEAVSEKAVDCLVTGYDLDVEIGILDVCTVDTSTELDGDIEGVIETMSAAFTAHVAVETTDTDELLLHLIGATADSEPLTVALPA